MSDFDPSDEELVTPHPSAQSVALGHSILLNKPVVLPRRGSPDVRGLPNQFMQYIMDRLEDFTTRRRWIGPTFWIIGLKSKLGLEVWRK